MLRSPLASAAPSGGLETWGERFPRAHALGYTRSPPPGAFLPRRLLAGRILRYLGVPGPDAVRILHDRRPGALFNEVFANHLMGL